MKKKKKIEEEEDINENEDIDDDSFSENEIPDPQEEEISEVDSPMEESIGDDDTLDIIIEISEDESIIDIIDPPNDPLIDGIIIDIVVSEDVDVVLSKHKLQGKHSLKYDSIFKGKKDDKLDENDSTSGYFNEKFEVDKSSFFYVESYDSESYARSKNLKEKVYGVLSGHTEINFLNNRRKPSKSDFNHYYYLLKANLKGESFTNIELFNELSVYFSDNLFNMFKLLDNKWRNLIILELQDHIGKNSNSKEITNRNIYIDTEVEFEHEDLMGDPRLFTGVIVETDYENSVFQIDSYENIYSVHISDITKILNNTKFRYNLNKLNNIDFL